MSTGRAEGAIENQAGGDDDYRDDKDGQKYQRKVIELMRGTGNGGFGTSDGDDHVEDVYGAENVPADECWFRVREWGTRAWREFRTPGKVSQPGSDTLLVEPLRAAGAGSACAADREHSYVSRMLQHSGAQPAALVTICWAILFYRYHANFSGLFLQRAS
jgi:hypothetical protein